MESAERLDRLWAALIDRAIVIPMGFGAAVVMPAVRNSPVQGLAALLIVAVVLGYIGYQLWLLSTLGQTIGKRCMKIRIVKLDDDQNGGFVVNVVKRGLVCWIITIIPFIGALFAVADPLSIFRDDRRCLHDLIAGTRVVKA